VLRDKLIFNAFTPEFGEELWVSDGTEMGTHILKNIDSTGQSFPYFPFSASILHDSLLLFTASNGAKRNQLWKTDGTEAGTTLLAEQALMGKEVNDILGKFGDSLIFLIKNSLGAEFWISDGSDEGTKLLKHIFPGAYGGYFTVLGKAFYFAAGDLSHGTELWKSDGTNNGTVLVKDILPGTKSSIPYHLTRHQNELFFVVGETSNGKDALWKTDGTPEGTAQIKQIAGANTFSYIRNLFSWGPYLYFSADDGIHGQELWRSDGTEEGTTMLADLNAGSASSDPENFTPFKNDLYFSANDGIHGYELWRLLSDNVVSIDEPHMAEILVFPNPAIDQLVVRRNVENGKLVARLFDANGRTVVQPTLLNEESTELNVNTLPNGIYFLEIRAEGSLERKVKKIVIVR
jgi:ELWxxDGT repeat protein